MLGVRKILAVGALIAGLLLPAQAMAAYEAWTRADLNLRVGPGVTYGVIDVIPYGEPVAVFGCLDGIEWCDVEWYGLRGWVSAYYLAQPGTSVYLPQVYTRIGLPIIVFSFDSYHDRYYRDRPWYKKRYGRWRGKNWRHDRDRDRDKADRPRKGERVQRPGPSKKVEKPRQRQAVEKPRQRQEVEKPRQRQEAKRPQRSKAEQPRQRQQSQKSKQRQASGQSSDRPRKNETSQRSKKNETSQRSKKLEVQRYRGQ